MADDLARLAPLQILPFADGIAYRDNAINHWHFPLPHEVFANALSRRGISMTPAMLGRCYRIRRGSVEILEGSDRIVEILGERRNRNFDPRYGISDVPEACSPALEASARGITAAILDELSSRAENTLDIYPECERTHLLRCYAHWELELCDLSDPTMRFLGIDRAGGKLDVRPRKTHALRRPFGIRAHWRDLYRVLLGLMPLEHIELSGAFRYVSPIEVVDLESIRDQVLGPFRALFR